MITYSRAHIAPLSPREFAAGVVFSAFLGAAVAVAVVLLGGCATVPPHRDMVDHHHHVRRLVTKEPRPIPDEAFERAAGRCAEIAEAGGARLDDCLKSSVLTHL